MRPGDASTVVSLSTVARESPVRMLLLLLLLLLLLPGAAFSEGRGQADAEEGQCASASCARPRAFCELFAEVGPVPSIIVDREEKFVEEIFDEAEPTVIRNTKAVTWPAMSKWNPEYFIENMEEFTVHASREPQGRMHTAAHPMGQLPGVRWLRPWEDVVVPSREFFAASAASAAGGGGGPYFYFFSNLRKLPALLQRDVGDTLSLQARFRPTMEMNVWIGTNGTGSPLHYDVAHNMYVQVSGEKRFRLFPPSDHLRLHLFPRVHPSTRMSQISLDAIRTDVFGEVSGASPMEVSLKKGQVLYIPPYWFHQTEVVANHSISVSICSESPQVDLREKIFLDHRLKLPADITVAEKIVAVVAYIASFFSEPWHTDDDDDDEVVLGESERADCELMRSFLAGMKESRFRTLLADTEVVGMDQATRKAEDTFKEWFDPIDRASKPPGSQTGLDAWKQGKVLLSKYAFLKTSNYRYDVVQWEIELMNHFEDIITLILGNPLVIMQFLEIMTSDKRVVSQWCLL